MRPAGPIAPGLPGCCGYDRLSGGTSASHCQAEPVVAGTIAFDDGSLWCTFACADHEQLLDEANPIGADPRYRAELERRRDGGAAVPVRPAGARPDR